MDQVNHHGASAPGLAAPERAEVAPQSETRARGGLALQVEAGTGDSGDCADDRAVVQIGADDHKQFATLAAQAARAGYMLHSLAGGGYLVCRWTMARELSSMQAVSAMLRQMGVRL